MRAELAMADHALTNAASSGVALDRETLKAIAGSGDYPGVVYLGRWGDGLLR